MTKDEALRLKNGDVIYLIDDSRLSIFSEKGVENSPLLRHGLRRITIGETGENYGNKPIHIFDVTGYLVNAAVSRNFAPELFFANPQAALVAFETYTQKMRHSLLATLRTLDQRITEVRAMTHTEHTQRIHAVTHG